MSGIHTITWAEESKEATVYVRSNGSDYQQCTFLVKIIKIENGSKKTFTIIPNSTKFANFSSMNDSQYTALLSRTVVECGHAGIGMAV